MSRRLLKMGDEDDCIGHPREEDEEVHLEGEDVKSILQWR